VKLWTELLTRHLGIGRPFVGYFSDAAGRINMADTCTFLGGLFCLVIVSSISKLFSAVQSRSRGQIAKVTCQGHLGYGFG
jgi:hypothetical protein